MKKPCLKKTQIERKIPKMLFFSTRDLTRKKYTSAQIIKQGLADDGGLFVPESIPTLTNEDLVKLTSLSYSERAAYILSLYLSDFTYEELLADCSAAYSATSFPGGAAPVVRLSDKQSVLELWHGPTAAFKDMALQIMPRLLSRSLLKTGETRTALILVATSGDTGKAALEGYRDIPGIKIIVFYPVDGVSTVQKLQMATQAGENVEVCAIEGNFDDAQSGVKQLFADASLARLLNEKNTFLSSANSINWGRLAPQIVYYTSAYCDMVKSGAISMGDEIDVCVPTGNFGNIFAAYLAKSMGLPLGKLICASNSNHILTDFLRTGVYDRNRDFYLTMSPSMDILISSNLERLLYFVAGQEKVRGYMEQLAQTGRYEVGQEILDKIHETFVGYFSNEENTARTIQETYRDKKYLIDTHTAVAAYCANAYAADHPEDNTPMLVVSTASPYKFADHVYRAVSGTDATSNLDALQELTAFTSVEIPYPLKGLAERKVRFSKTISENEMKEAVLTFANSKKTTSR